MRRSRLRWGVAVGLAVGLAGCTSAAPPPAHEAGVVYREGTRLYVDGASYRFHGLNYYDINGTVTGENPYHPGTNVVGGCRRYTETPRLDETFRRIGTAANVVRGWFFQPASESVPAGSTAPQRDWSLFDHTLDAVRRAGLRVIVTLTDQYGNCDLPRDRQKTLDWYRSGYRSEVPAGELVPYRAYVREIVTRYRGRGEILAWQLVSEGFAPNGDGTCDETAAASALRAFADDVGGLVKSVDPGHLVSFGTGKRGCGIEGPALRDYGLLHGSPSIDLCDYHDYDESATPIPPKLNAALQICSKLGKPVFVGETGVKLQDLAGKPACLSSLAQTQRCRSLLLREKFRAQLSAASQGLGQDVAGVLVWSWCDDRWTACTPRRYDVVTGDPTLGVLAKLPTS